MSSPADFSISSNGTGSINAAEPVRRRTKAAPRNKCKACERCRTRKIKCNGQWPTCGLCGSLGHECIYSQDGRQNSHIGKQSYYAMVKKVADLEETIKQLGSRHIEVNNSSPRPMASTLSPSGAIANPGSSVQPSRNSGLNNSFPENHNNLASSSNSQEIVLNTGQEITDNEPDELPSDMNTMFPLQRNPQQNGLEVHGDDHEGGLPEMIQNLATTGQSDVNVIVSNEGGISVHGQTSAFHFHERSPISTTSYPQPRSSRLGFACNTATPGPFDVKEFDQIRGQLFAFAAFNRQRETNFLQDDNCEVDFDGIDFDTAVHFLELHWNRQHCAFLLTYRPIIMEHIATNGQHVNKLLLNAIYFASSLHSKRGGFQTHTGDSQSTGLQFLTRFKSLLETELEVSSIPSVVALLLMGSSLVSHGRQTLGWLYCGLAYRMIIDLGLHLDTSTMQTSHSVTSSAKITFEIAEIEMHRRVFWGAYVNDKFQSLYFGRPPAIPKTGFEPPQIFLDTYEEMELWSPYVDPKVPNLGHNHYKPRPALVLSSFQILIHLAEISAEIIESFYTPQSSKMSISAADQALRNIQDRLDHWQVSVPSSSRFHPPQDPTPPPHQITPHTTFHTLRILAHRPFLAEGHLSHIGLNVVGIQDTCTQAATQIYELACAYRDAFTLEHAPYLLSYAIFSAVTVMPRIEVSGTDPRRSIELIVFFWNALKELQRGSNFGLRRPLIIVRDFLQRAGIDINRLSTRQNTPDRDLTQPRGYQTEFVQDETGNWDASDLMTYLEDDCFGMLNNSSEPNFTWTDVPVTVEGQDILYGLFR